MFAVDRARDQPRGAQHPGERIYRLPSLGFPAAPVGTDRASVAELRAYGAVELFVERAISVDATFVLTDRNAPVVAEICRRLDGIPLAIELAAMRTSVLGVERLAEKLDDRFRLLAGGSRVATPRQQTMRALIDWSYDLLTESERGAFRALAIFAGGWTLEAAAAVCFGGTQHELDALDALIRSPINRSWSSKTATATNGIACSKRSGSTVSSACATRTNSTTSRPDMQPISPASPKKRPRRGESVPSP